MSQTDWLAPQVLAENASNITFTHPRLAVDASGGAAAVFAGAWVETSGSQVISRRRDIYASFSGDRGATWTPPQQLSNSAYINDAPSITAGPTGSFHFAWMSGDAFTGFRLHTAITSDKGISITSTTTVQGVLAVDQGFLMPKIAVSGTNEIVLRTAYPQEVPAVLERGYLSVRSDVASSWTSTRVNGPTPMAYWPGWLTFGNDLDVNINRVISVFSYRNQSYFSSSVVTEKALLTHSHDSGLTWQDGPVFNVPPSSYVGVPSIKYGSGLTWLSIWPVCNVDGIGSYLFTSSRDNGTTWTAPEAVDPEWTGNVGRSEDNLSISSDEHGRWLAVTPLGEMTFSYWWSDNDASTWNGLENVSGGIKNSNIMDTVFLGNGRWGVAWSDASGIQMSILNWGPSVVDEWSLY